jgi:hypothetical protein
MALRGPGIIPVPITVGLTTEKAPGYPTYVVSTDIAFSPYVFEQAAAVDRYKTPCTMRRASLIGGGWSLIMLNEQENILSALREKPLKVYEIMKRVNILNEEACQSLLLKMRDDGLVKFDIHKGRWLIG